MSEDKKHTPLPWYIIESAGNLNDGYWIGPEQFHSICEVRKGAEDEEYVDPKFDAEFIVRACNSHYELLQAARLAVVALNSFETALKEPQVGALQKVREELRAAIAKAEGNHGR